MKKLPLFIVLIAYFAAQFTHAQRPTDQGKMLLNISSNSFSSSWFGTNSVFSAGITNSVSQTSSGNTLTSKSSSFSLTPKAGYFVMKNLVMGAELSVGSSSIRNDDAYKKNKIGMTMFGPFIRYYSEQNSWFYPFLEGGISLGTLRYEYDYTDPLVDDDKSKYSLSNLYGAAGMAFIITEHFMIDLKLNINRLFIAYPKDRYLSSQHDTNVFLQLGFTSTF